jgi:hypothetical protein
MSKVIESNKDRIIKLAQDSNFWGKRKRDSKLAVCDTIIAALELSQQQLESSTLCDWLDQNKPLPKLKAAKVSNKPSAATMTGEETKKLETMSIVPDGMYIITAAQNNTCVAPVFAQLKDLASELDAKLIVLPIHYNKNAFSAAVEDEREYFVGDVKPYLEREDVWLSEMMGVRLAPSANVLPTAKYPMNSAAQLNVGELVTIIPATKQQMQTLPRLNGQPIKEAWATGCCTVYNYTESRAGSEAETEHVFGGLLVRSVNGEVDVTNIRQGRDGTLQVYPNTKGEACVTASCVRSPDVVLGDLHCEMQDLEAYNHTLAWLYAISPNRVAVHDILHFETRSHHNRKSGKHLFKMYVNGQNVRKDLERVITQLNEIADSCTEVYIVESNHNSALDNWLDDSSYNPKQDPENAKLYYLLNYAICEAIEAGHDATALEVAFRDIVEQSDLPKIASNIRFGSMDTPEVWNGVDVSQHGHKGQNGSMGNPTLFNKWRIDMVTGHTHSPKIVGDVLTVGVLAKYNQGYNKGGASSWGQSNCIIHPNGVKQMVRVFPLTK